MIEHLLSIRGLQTYFETRAGTARAVDGLDLDIRAGEIVGLVGESGSGKSAAGFSILGLVDRPGRIVGGSISFKGQDLVKASEEERTQLRGDRITMIFQDPLMTLNPVLRIDTQMMETIRLHTGLSRAEARARSLDALKAVGIPAPMQQLKAYPHELSGGMRQRVAIAIALLNKPDLIIADEPTTALDVTIQGQILYLVRQLAETNRTALIWITHDLGVASELADRIAVMYAGRIVEEGPADDVLDRPRHPYTAGLIRSLPEGQPRKQRLAQIAGAAPSLLKLPGGCPFRPRCAEATDACLTAPEERRDGTVRFRCHHPLNVSREALREPADCRYA
jgi:peptide/nickel transport system ATP-binding protein